MKVFITYTTIFNKEKEIERTEELNLLSDLVKLMEEEGENLVLSVKNKRSDCDLEVEVYNNFRE